MGEGGTGEGGDREGSKGSRAKQIRLLRWSIPLRCVPEIPGRRQNLETKVVPTLPDTACPASTGVMLP